MLIIGIDPGISGSIKLLEDGIIKDVLVDANNDRREK